MIFSSVNVKTPHAHEELYGGSIGKKKPLPLVQFILSAKSYPIVS